MHVCVCARVCEYVCAVCVCVVGGGQSSRGENCRYVPQDIFYAIIALMTYNVDTWVHVYEPRIIQ